MSLKEEGGATARAMLAGFSGNPLCLAAVVLSAMFAVLTYFALQAEEVRAHEARMALLEHCLADDEKL